MTKTTNPLIEQKTLAFIKYWKQSDFDIIEINTNNSQTALESIPDAQPLRVDIRVDSSVVFKFQIE